MTEVVVRVAIHGKDSAVDRLIHAFDSPWLENSIILSFRLETH